MWRHAIAILAAVALTLVFFEFWGEFGSAMGTALKVSAETAASKPMPMTVISADPGCAKGQACPNPAYRQCRARQAGSRTMSGALGRFDGNVHILPVRIYYEDTDLSGVVYHANYLRFMERGRSEYFRCAGIERLAMLEDDEPTAWTLRKVAIEYFRPARVDDLIEVHTTCTDLTGARMTADQKIYAAGELLMQGTVQACIITLAGRPRRIPQEVRTKLSPFVVKTGV